MDRKISTQQLRREKTTRLLKWTGGILLFCSIIFLISKLFQPVVNATDVFIEKVDVGNIDITVSASGKIVPAFEEIITSPITSRILEVYKKSGDKVEVGTPILKLDLQSTKVNYDKMLDEEAMKLLQMEQLKLQHKSSISGMELKLKVQEMELEQKRVVLHNERYLDTLGAGTLDKVRQAEMNVKVSELQFHEDEQNYENEKALMKSAEKIKTLELNIFQKGLSETRRTLDDAQIRAPRAAILSFVSTEIGSNVSAGSKIAMLSDLSHFKVEGKIADSYGDRISVGRIAIVKIADNVHEGVVSNLTPISENGIISFSVQLKVNNDSNLRSGLDCDVYIIDSRKENIRRLPNGKYYSGKGEYELFVLNGDILHKRDVRLGDCNYDYVEVLEGLVEGDEVLISDIGNKKNKSKLKYKK